MKKQIIALLPIVFIISACSAQTNRVISHNHANKLFVGEKIEDLNIIINLTSPETEARWMFLNDQLLSLVNGAATYKTYEDALKQIHETLGVVDSKTLFLYYCDLNKEVTVHGQKLIILNCYFIVDKISGRVAKVAIIDYAVEQ